MMSEFLEMYVAGNELAYLTIVSMAVFVLSAFIPLTFGITFGTCYMPWFKYVFYCLIILTISLAIAVLNSIDSEVKFDDVQAQIYVIGLSSISIFYNWKVSKWSRNTAWRSGR
ncbi:hypothetical protein [Aliivibrio fischeri]|uniref:hypothetical protein n=1 Tax=Aliivibrio fischeri TaxID=668 RepID=UPI0007C4B6F7|nr:hypothetical protein [Aliivibrio fischeri]